LVTYQDGIRAGPDKTSTINEMKPPTNGSDLALDMIDQFCEFSSDLANSHNIPNNSSVRSEQGSGTQIKTEH